MLESSKEKKASAIRESKIHLPTLVSTLAPFRVSMSSPRLFLSPFIFQFPPTKNFLDISADFCEVFSENYNRVNCPTGCTSSEGKSKSERAAPCIYEAENDNPSSGRSPLVYDSTPSNASPHLRKGKA